MCPTGRSKEDKGIYNVDKRKMEDENERTRQANR